MPRDFRGGWASLLWKDPGRVGLVRGLQRRDNLAGSRLLFMTLMRSTVTAAQTMVPVMRRTRSRRWLWLENVAEERRADKHVSSQPGDDGSGEGTEDFGELEGGEGDQPCAVQQEGEGEGVGEDAEIAGDDEALDADVVEEQGVDGDG